MVQVLIRPDRQVLLIVFYFKFRSNVFRAEEHDPPLRRDRGGVPLMQYAPISPTYPSPPPPRAPLP